VLGTAKDIGAQLLGGLARPVYSTAIGVSDLLGADETADRLRRTRDTAEEFIGEAKTGAGKVANIAGATAGELAQFAMPGGLLGKAARLPALAKAAPTIAKVVAPATRTGRVASGVALGSPLSLARGIQQDESIAGSFGEMLDSDWLREASKSTPARLAIELGFDAGAGGILELAGAALAKHGAKRAGARADALREDVLTGERARVDGMREQTPAIRGGMDRLDAAESTAKASAASDERLSDQVAAVLARRDAAREAAQAKSRETLDLAKAHDEELLRAARTAKDPDELRYPMTTSVRDALARFQRDVGEAAQRRAPAPEVEAPRVPEPIPVADPFPRSSPDRRTISRTEFGPVDTPEAMTAARDRARDYLMTLRGKAFTNQATGLTAEIRKSAIGKARHYSSTPDKVAAMRILDQLIEDAVPVELDVPPRGAKSKTNVEAYHYFTADAVVDGKPQQFRLTLTEERPPAGATSRRVFYWDLDINDPSKSSKGSLGPPPTAPVTDPAFVRPEVPGVTRQVDGPTSLEAGRDVQSPGAPTTSRPPDDILPPTGPSDKPEDLFGGLPTPLPAAAVRAAGDNLLGGAAGATAGMVADEENPLRGAATGFTAGALGQAGLKALLDRAGSAGHLAPRPAPRQAAAAPAPTRAYELPPNRWQPPPKEPPGPSVPPPTPTPGPREGDGALKAREYFNLPRLGLPTDLEDQVAARISTIAPTAQGVPKSVVTNRETQRRAAELLQLKTADELAAIDWRRMTGEEGVAIASLVGDRTKQIDEAMARLRDPLLDRGSREQIESDVARLDREANQLLRTVMRGASQQGRDLQANKILANLRSPEAVMIRAQRLLGQERLLAPDEKTEILRLANTGDERALWGYVAGLRKAPVSEQVMMLRKSGLLTSLVGRAYDVTSNVTSWIEHQGLSKPAQVLTDILLSKAMTGQRTRHFGNTKLYIGQVGAGFKRGLTDAAESMGVDALKRGDLPTDGLQLRQRARRWVDRMNEIELSDQQLARHDIPRVTRIDLLPGEWGGRGNRLLQAYMNVGFQFSSVPDRIVKGAAYRGAMVDAAESLAHAEGTPKARRQQRVQELLAAPTDEMIAAATLEAERITFTNDEAMARAARWVMRLPDTMFPESPRSAAAARAVLEQLMPFRKTPGNVAARLADYSGVAGVRAVVAISALSKAAKEGAEPATIRALQREVTTLVGRATTGAAAMYGLGMALYNRGVLTGTRPASQTEANQWDLEGRQANSVLIGDEWIPIARMTTLGAVLAAGANLAAALENDDLGAMEKTAVALLGGVRTSLDQPMVTGTRTLLDAVQDPVGQGEWFARGQVASFVPTGAAQVARAMDGGVVRQPSSLGEAIQARVPGLRGQLPAKIDAFGEEVRTTRDPADILANPFGGATDRRTEDPLIAEMHRVGVTVSARPRKKAGEGPRQYERRMREEGQILREAVGEVVASEEYQQLGRAVREAAQRDPSFAEEVGYSPAQQARYIQDRQKAMIENEISRLRRFLTDRDKRTRGGR
jgi:hypothetical protein